MFIGRYYHTIEEKGRVSLPKSFREMEKQWVITRGLDGGVFLFPQKNFHEQVQALNQLGFTKKAHRDFVRLLTNDADAVEVDSQGRVTIPEYLRATAQLTKNVVIVGSFERVEIWNVDKYHAYLDTLAGQAEAIAEQIGTTHE
ncbi:division/cell wall cluster transcriptional repressor MraZ [Patescibacteria group bacterium]|nr:division/cell wall cluster transcriptional repressor MraZ [Patescibacteria group bacterium]